MRKLKKEIINLCNQGGLPLDAIYFVVKDTLRDIEDALIQQDKQQAAAMQEQSVEINEPQEEQENVDVDNK